MSWRACVLLTLLGAVRGEYPPSTPGPGYTTPVVNTPLHNTPVTYSAPTPVPYTTAVVHGQPSTPTTPKGTTVSSPSSYTPYTSTDFRSNNGYFYPRPPFPFSGRDPYSSLPQQSSPDFISHYYKQPPYVFPHPQQPPAPYPSLHPPAFQPHSCPTPNNHPFHPQQPYFQSNLLHVPNPLSLLSGFVAPSSFHATVHPPAPRGPLPSPGYYSPAHPPSQPLFSASYSSPVNHHSPQQGY